MKIAITGGTGLIGRYLLRKLEADGHTLQAWKRTNSDISGLDTIDVHWVDGELTNLDSMQRLVEGCDAVVHSALWKPGKQFQGGEGPLPQFAQVNVIGTLQLIDAAMKAGAQRFVHLSSCAVYDEILDDRPLDESHPSWPRSHYGAHKAAIEPFIQSLAKIDDFNICGLRPTAVYGAHHPIENSKWFELANAVKRGEEVHVERGSKEVHAADVAKAISLVINADKSDVAGQVFNCVDHYISKHCVATIAKELSGSNAEIIGEQATAKHTIETAKLKSLGMTFGGEQRLRETIRELIG